MRIKSLSISNFRGIHSATLSENKNAIVIAGPNGCGKSSIYDAIRLLKSAYGEYHQNEYQSWLKEFQFNLNKLRQETRSLLYDAKETMRISAEFELTNEEINFLKKNAYELYERMNWSYFRGAHTADGDPVVVSPVTRKVQGAQIAKNARKLKGELEEVIDQEKHKAEVTLVPGGDIVATSSPVMELVFSMFRPHDVGVIDYHGPDRRYSREQLGQMNLKIEESEEKAGQHALYNTQNKYTKIKSEMAQSYIRNLLIREVGIDEPKDDLSSSLSDLFKSFFPEKEFLGAIPTRDGGLKFPVRLENGKDHDIDELSSGEKEVLLGYLRIRKTAPKNSIILIDEPELHLNPRLIRALPRFYQKHLGEALGNQIWLITHSDTLLRAAVEEPSYTVYHMRRAYESNGANQLEPVSASAELDRAMIDLIGDLATYDPRSKIIFVEGENSEFDANLIRELFPSIENKANLVSVGTKSKVRLAHSLLERAAESGGLDAKIYSIVDRDEDLSSIVESERCLRWDVYHIENYLLEPRYIREAIRAIVIDGEAPTEEAIKKELKECAKSCIEIIVRSRVEQYVNQLLVNCLSSRTDRNIDVVDGSVEAIDKSLKRMGEVSAGDLCREGVEWKVKEIRKELVSSLATDNWLKEFRGRDILKAFVQRQEGVRDVRYEKFRNLIITRMRDAGWQPLGMQNVVNKILNE